MAGDVSQGTWSARAEGDGMTRKSGRKGRGFRSQAARRRAEEKAAEKDRRYKAAREAS